MGRTSRGERMPWVRMLSASSFKESSSKVRRGLVLDSVSNARGRLRYSVALAMVLVFMAMAPFERLHCVGCCEADALSHPLRGGKGLGAWGLLLLEGFGEALQSQVVVPPLGESLVLLVKADEVNVVIANDGAAPLLHANVVVAVIKRIQVWAVRESKLEAH